MNTLTGKTAVISGFLFFYASDGFHYPSLRQIVLHNEVLLGPGESETT